MGMKMAERLTRDQTLFYMRRSVANPSQNAANTITKAPELKEFLLFLVEREPKRMIGILKTMSEKASAAIRAKDAQKEKEKTAEKRAAPSGVDSHETCKRAKLADTVSGKAANTWSCGRQSQMRDYASVAPPPYSYVEDFNSDTETDDGVELATPDPGDNLAQEETYAEEPADDEEDEHSEVILNEVQQAKVQSKALAEEELPEKNQPTDGQDNDVRQQDSQEAMPTGRSTQTGTGEQSSSDGDLHISLAQTYYMIERGLTNGDTEIVSKLRNNSPILRKPEVDIVFDLCQKFDSNCVRFELVQYLQNRFAEIGTVKKTDRVPSTCDLDHPDEIYDALCITQAHSSGAKIFRAYGQMRLFDKVNKLAQEDQAAAGAGLVKEEKLFLWHLERLAIRKAGNVSDSEKKAKIQNYKDEYHGGSKWTDVSKWFGGKGVVIVFVVAGIGSQTIARGLTKEQRLALEALSEYLTSIKKMVSTLGPDSLEEYCRHGHLPEAKIQELDELEGVAAPEGDVVDDDDDDDDDGETTTEEEEEEEDDGF